MTNRAATALSDKIQRVQQLEVLGILAGGIAHDLNNIFLVMHGYGQLAQQAVAPDSPAYGHMERVLSAARRGERMVTQILRFTRERDHERQPTDLHSVAEDAISLLRSTLPSTVEIRAHLDPRAGSILADDVQIYQVLMNLGMNAADAMRERGGTLDLFLNSIDVDARLAATLGELTPGPHAHLSLTDTGHGMDADTLEHIYDAFFTTKQEHGGTGLGLAVVRTIVRAHNGAMTVSSEPGRGTTFDLYFPQIDAAAAPVRETVAESRGGSERILVVDDEPELAWLVEQVLSHLGYDVTSMTNGLKALELVRGGTESFDLIVTDQTMPQVSGLELANALRESGCDVPVILTTGFSNAITPESVSRAKISSVVRKPYHEDELGRAVREALDCCAVHGAHC